MQATRRLSGRESSGALGCVRRPHWESITRFHGIAFQSLLLASCVALTAIIGCKSACEPGKVLKNGTCVSGFASSTSAVPDQAGSNSSAGANAEVSSSAPSTPSTSSGSSTSGTSTGSPNASNAGASAASATGAGGAAANADAAGADAPEAADAANGPCAGHGDESFCDAMGTVLVVRNVGACGRPTDADPVSLASRRSPRKRSSWDWIC
jgi:hypothetical protein